MKCINCGFEYGEEYAYCPNCGAVAPVAEPVSLNPTADKVLLVLKDGLFLAACILISASCVFSVLAEGFPIINILITIFLWITYAKSRKGVVDSGMLRCVSGSVYASYIVNNVACGILIGCGALISLVFAVIPAEYDIIGELASALTLEIPELAYFTQEVILFVCRIIGPIFIVAALIILLINIFGMRKIHRFVKSVYQGIDLQNPNFENPRLARNWLIFFGVMSGLSTISSLSENAVAALSSGCLAATAIIAVILINKHFVSSYNE